MGLLRDWIHSNAATVNAATPPTSTNRAMSGTRGAWCVSVLSSDDTRKEPDFCGRSVCRRRYSGIGAAVRGIDSACSRGASLRGSVEALCAGGAATGLGGALISESRPDSSASKSKRWRSWPNIVARIGSAAIGRCVGGRRLARRVAHRRWTRMGRGAAPAQRLHGRRNDPPGVVLVRRRPGTSCAAASGPRRPSRRRPPSARLSRAAIARRCGHSGRIGPGLSATRSRSMSFATPSLRDISSPAGTCRFFRPPSPTCRRRPPAHRCDQAPTCMPSRVRSSRPLAARLRGRHDSAGRSRRCRAGRC